MTAHPPTRVPGTSVFLTAAAEGVPHALLHNLNHNKVLHERIVLLTVHTRDIPHVPDGERIEIVPLGPADLARLRQLMQKYHDLPMDLADAALVTVAEREGITRVFTLDRRDFEVYRPAKIGRFSLVP